MSLLDLYTSCQLCPRNCKADRQHGQTGFCHMPADLKVARAALHMWEEPCISGKAGSGAVFFSGCSMGCVFCQNHAIAAGQSGKRISIERLADIFSGTANKRCQQYQPCHTGALCPIHCTGPCYGQGKGTASANHLQLQRLFFSDCSAYSF